VHPEISGRPLIIYLVCEYVELDLGHSDYDKVDFEPIQVGKMFRSNEDMDASGDAGLTLNEAISFERHDHGWTDGGLT
jgi:hypothetical protein